MPSPSHAREIRNHGLVRDPTEVARVSPVGVPQCNPPRNCKARVMHSRSCRLRQFSSSLAKALRLLSLSPVLAMLEVHCRKSFVHETACRKAAHLRVPSLGLALRCLAFSHEICQDIMQAKMEASGSKGNFSSVFNLSQNSYGSCCMYFVAKQKTKDAKPRSNYIYIYMCLENKTTFE